MVMVNFYDARASWFADVNAKNLTELAGATICMLQGSTHELNLADWQRQHNIQFQIVLLDTPTC